MKRDFISFLWIEPSSVSHLSWVFWSKVYFKCVQNMYTPDQEAGCKDKGAALEWGRCLLGAWSLWPGVVVTLWPSIGHFSIADSGLKCQKDHLGHPDNDWEILKHSSPLPRGLTLGGKQRGFRASASVLGCTLCEQEGGVALPGPVLGLFLAAPASVVAGLVQCIRSENARHHLVCRRAVIVWDVCLPHPPPDSHVEFLTPKVWKANLAFLK